MLDRCGRNLEAGWVVLAGPRRLVARSGSEPSLWPATTILQSCQCWEHDAMPLVNIHMAAGRTLEQKRAVMSAITDAIVEHLGVAPESVRVWIDEFPATDYMTGGELLADKRARQARER
jgi:4-oxalocrotonate tautomerase